MYSTPRCLLLRLPPLSSDLFRGKQADPKTVFVAGASGVSGHPSRPSSSSPQASLSAREWTSRNLHSGLASWHRSTG